MKPFEPIGAEARWRTVYTLLKRHGVGDTVTYEALAEALDLDPVQNRNIIQAAVRRAAREYEETDKHALTVAPNIGYRVVAAQEHLALARKHQRRSTRELAAGRSKVINVDFNGMDPDVRKGFEVMSQGFSMVMDINRRIFTRQNKMESVINEITTQVQGAQEGQARNEAEIATLKERLARLETG